MYLPRLLKWWHYLIATSHYVLGQIFVHFYENFALFIVFLYIVISQRFSFHNYAFLWSAVTISYNMMVSLAFFVFVCHTAYCFLLLVCCMWLKNIPLRKPTWIGGWNISKTIKLSPEDRIYVLHLKPGGKCYATTWVARRTVVVARFAWNF